MAEDGHAPTFSARGARTLYLLGQRVCPECDGDLHPGGGSALHCPTCGEHYPIGGGEP